MRMKRLWWLGLLAAAALCAACAAADPPEQETVPGTEAQTEEAEPFVRRLSMATNGNWSTSFKGTIMAEELEALEERADGKLSIRLYDRNRLGNDAHLISGVQAGTIDIMQSSPASQINVVPEAAFFDVPGLFDTLEEWNDLLSGGYLEVMQKYYEDAGLVLLDVFAYSWRTLSSRTPVADAADLAGMRIRTIENKYQEAFWNALGAAAVPYDYAELYFCISEGMADAQENLLDVILVDNLFELQNSITFTRHLPMISAVTMRRELYESLSDAERESLAWFTGDLKSRLMSQMPEEEERLAETLDHDYGMELHAPSYALKEAIRSGSEEVLSMLREDLGDMKTDAFLEAVEQVRESHTEVSPADVK